MNSESGSPTLDRNSIGSLCAKIGVAIVGSAICPVAGTMGATIVSGIVGNAAWGALREIPVRLRRRTLPLGKPNHDLNKALVRAISMACREFEAESGQEAAAAFRAYTGAPPADWLEFAEDDITPFFRKLASSPTGMLQIEADNKTLKNFLENPSGLDLLEITRGCLPNSVPDSLRIWLAGTLFHQIAARFWDEVKQDPPSWRAYASEVFIEFRERIAGIDEKQDQILRLLESRRDQLVPSEETGASGQERPAGTALPAIPVEVNESIDILSKDLNRDLREIQNSLHQIVSKLDTIEGDTAWTRRFLGKLGSPFAIGLFVIFAVIALGIPISGLVRQEQGLRKIDEVRRNYTEPAVLAAMLTERIREVAEEEIRKNRGNGSRISAIEKARDREINEIEEIIEAIREGLGENADPVFVRAAEILADPLGGGPRETLEYLKASRPRVLEKIEQLKEEEEARRADFQASLRQQIRILLFEAKMSRSQFEWEDALDTLRLAVSKSPDWWQPRNDLGQLAQEMARWDEAAGHYQEALKIVPNEEDRLTVLGNLGTLWFERGEMNRAEPVLREALAQCETILGPDHLLTLGSVNNLASLLQAQEKNAEAEMLYQRAIEGFTEILGEDHRETLVSMNNLAALREANGDYDGSVSLFRKVLQIRESIYTAKGKPFHPDSLMSMNNLAFALDSKGEYEEAEKLYRKCSEKQAEILGADHPDTLQTRHNLAYLLKSTGRHREAKRDLENVLEIRKRILGEGHPDTLKSMDVLAGIYLFTDEARAEELARQALEIRKRKLGDAHRDTLDGINRLAMLLMNKKDYEGAEFHFREALRGKREHLGPTDPSTLTGQNNLAFLLTRRRKYPEAEDLFRRTLATQELSLGGDDENTLITVTNLGNLLGTQGRYAEAEASFYRAYRGFAELLGRDHPRTLAVKRTWENTKAIADTRGKESPTGDTGKSDIE